jgi:hypothetical protein
MESKRLDRTFRQDAPELQWYTVTVHWPFEGPEKDHHDEVLGFDEEHACLTALWNWPDASIVSVGSWSGSRDSNGKLETSTCPFPAALEWRRIES